MYSLLQKKCSYGIQRKLINVNFPSEKYVQHYQEIILQKNYHDVKNIKKLLKSCLKKEIMQGKSNFVDIFNIDCKFSRSVFTFDFFPKRVKIFYFTKIIFKILPLKIESFQYYYTSDYLILLSIS